MTNEDTLRSKKLKEILKSGKFRDLEDVLREIIDKECPGGYDLLCKYRDTVDEHGLDSKEASDLYNSIIKEHKPLKDWLDMYNRLEQ